MATLLISNTDNAENAGSWTLADTVIFQDGETPCVNNVNQSTLAAGGAHRVLIRRDWKADIGTPTDPLKVEVSETSGGGAMLEVDGGQGTLYYSPDGLTTNDLCDLLRVIGLMDVVVSGAAGFTIAVLEAMSAYTQIASSVDVPVIELGGSARVDVFNTGSATRPTAVDVAQGRLNLFRGVNGELAVHGGQVMLDCSAEAVATSTVRGGSLSFIDLGVPNTINWRGGIIDVSKLRREIVPVNLNVWLPFIDPVAWAMFKSHPLVKLSSTVISEKMRGEP